MALNVQGEKATIPLVKAMVANARAGKAMKAAKKRDCGEIAETAAEMGLQRATFPKLPHSSTSISETMAALF